MIWLTGSNGMLGKELSIHFKNEGFLFTGTDREVDIIDYSALLSYSKNYPVQWIINCAAYTAVDKAEDEEETCRLLNITGPYNIARLSKELNAKLIHISTDFVFNGKGNKPYTEDDKTDPIGVYGLSKRDGEIMVLNENEKSFIIRTAWLYGKYGNNFVNTMLRLFNEKERISVVNDQKGSPTWANELAKVIVELMKFSDNGISVPYGIYNYTNEGEITWHDFAKEIYRQALNLRILEKECEIKPCASADFPSKATRPSYSVLDKAKIKKALGINIPEWEKSLNSFLFSIKNR